MRFIIIGLGNLGSNLSKALIKDGHEVFGVDISIDKVEKYKEELTHTLSIDVNDEQSILHLPLSDTDVVIVSIGEDLGSSVSATALLKKHFNGRIIARSISPIHTSILEAMGIVEILSPEKEYAYELAHRINVREALKSMDLPGGYEIIEVRLPKQLIGLNLKDIDLKNKFEAHIITIIKQSEKKNIFGNKTMELSVHGILHSNYVFEENDILLIFGKIKNITAFLNHYEAIEL
jgi:trk system potassium uptake protein